MTCKIIFCCDVRKWFLMGQANWLLFLLITVKSNAQFCFSVDDICHLCLFQNSIMKSFSYRNLSAIQDREICCYSISCKEKENIGKHKNTCWCNLKKIFLNRQKASFCSLDISIIWVSQILCCRKFFLVDYNLPTLYLIVLQKYDFYF